MQGIDIQFGNMGNLNMLSNIIVMRFNIKL